MAHSSGRVFIIVGARFVVLLGLTTHYRESCSMTYHTYLLFYHLTIVSTTITKNLLTKQLSSHDIQITEHILYLKTPIILLYLMYLFM